MPSDHASAEALAQYFDAMTDDADEVSIPVVFVEQRRVFHMCPICCANLLRAGLCTPGLNTAEELRLALMDRPPEEAVPVPFGSASIWSAAGVTIDQVEDHLHKNGGHEAPWVERAEHGKPN